MDCLLKKSCNCIQNACPSLGDSHSIEKESGSSQNHLKKSAMLKMEKFLIMKRMTLKMWLMIPVLQDQLQLQMTLSKSLNSKS